MASSILNGTSLTLNNGTVNEITLDSTVSTELAITGTDPGGVDLIGIENITLVSGGEWNQGTTPLSGHCAAFAMGQNTSAIDRFMSYGNGVDDDSYGIVMPDAGTIVAWSIGAESTETVTVEYYHNRAATGNTITLTASQAVSEFVSFPFSAGDEIAARIVTLGASINIILTFFLRFGT